MENLFSILSTNAGSTTNASNPEIGSSQSPQFSIYTPLTFFPIPSDSPTEPSFCPATYHTASSPCESLPFPYTHSPEQTEIVQCSPSADPMHPYFFDHNRFGMQSSPILQPNEWTREQERRALDALRTKMARCNRRLARQRSAQRNQSRHSSSGANRGQMDARRKPLNGAQSSRTADNKDLYKFYPNLNKKLRFLVRKELRNSDVGSLGRIVLPKRDTEENLPTLSDKEGIQLVFRDLFSNQKWDLKFKYWSNNKSRMYVLENTGDFVRCNGLKIGDVVNLYEDESRDLYFSIEKVEREIAAEPSPIQQQQQQEPPTDYNQNYSFTPHTYQLKEEEEDASLALLIEQFNHNKQEANSLMTLSADVGCSYTQNEELFSDTFNNLASSSSSSAYCPPAAEAMPPPGQTGALKDDDQYMDDCYTGLDMLPDVYSYNFL